MVQKYNSPIRVYKYPFELVMTAYERRFPTCDMIPILASTEILCEETSDDGAVRVVDRQCLLHADVPYLLKKIMGVDFIHFRQKNTLNMRDRTLHIEAWNESYASRVVISETCTYSVHPENGEWTCFEQMASLDVKSFFGFESTVEKIAMKQYSASISKGKEIIEHFIKQLRDEGVTYVAPFAAPSCHVSRVNDLMTAAGDTSKVDSDVTTRGHVERARSELSDLELSGPETEPVELASTVRTTQTRQGSRRLSSTVDSDGRSQLEAEYIQRCLGQLTPLQESQLIQLRAWVCGLLKGKTPGDATLLRFLRARDFSVEKAREMLSASLVWRKKHQVDRLLHEYTLPAVVQQYYPGIWHHCDTDGRPLYVIRLGQMDVKGLVKSIGEEGLLKLVLHICEEGLQLADESTMKLGRPICSWTLLADLDGLNMRHLWRPGIKALLRIIEIMEANYPETMSRVLIIQAPRVFPILWTIVSTFIDDKTRAKFLFCDGDFRAKLPDYIPEHSIPDFLGGSASCKVNEGGLIPKSMYLTDDQLDSQKKDLCGGMDSVYHCVSLTRGQVHEVLVRNEDRGSVLCWDFDIIKSDVLFSVFRTVMPIHCRDSQPTGAMHVLETLNPLSDDAEHRSVIDKTWREGVDYFRVEPPLLCHGGESIQGSHVTSHACTYILQWRHHDPSSSMVGVGGGHQPHQHHHPHHHHHLGGAGAALELFDSITTHKARIMYYHELLASSDYRGSMTSLNSGTSGFSSLSSQSQHTHSLNSSRVSR